MKRLMIIDDRIAERKDVYHNVLSERFDLVYVEKASTLMDKIDSESVDGYVLDIVLTNWSDIDGKRLALQKVLARIGTSRPIILLSNEYKMLVSEGELTKLFNDILDGDFKVNQLYLWDEFVRISNNSPDDLNPIADAINISLATHQRTLDRTEANKFQLGIVTALREELDPFLAHLLNKETVKKQNVSYTCGNIVTEKGTIIKIVAAHQEEMGTVDAAIVSTSLVREFGVEYLVMIGVCGGRDGKSQIGDIIIPNEIVAYQKGKIGDNGLMMDIDISKSNVNCRMTFEGRCENIISNIFQTYGMRLLSQGESLELSRPTLRFDEMACGENVVNKEGELEQIASKTNKPKLCAIDMETYSIYRLNNFLSVSTIVIKSVMDLSSKKSDKFKSYAAFVSANFLYHVLNSEILKIER